MWKCEVEMLQSVTGQTSDDLKIEREGEIERSNSTDSNTML